MGPAAVVDLERKGIVDYELYGPEHFERREREAGNAIERGDILIIHTGYHRYDPENWADRSQADETRSFMRHPGPTPEFAQCVLDCGVRWLAVDAGTADHPMNTVIRTMRADEAEEVEKKLGRSLSDIIPRPEYQIMQTLLFPHLVVHIENLGSDIDQVLHRKVQFGCFSWRFQGGEAAFCRAVAFEEWSYRASNPSSTARAWPVMYEAASEHSQRRASAASSGRPIRPRGMPAS